MLYSFWYGRAKDEFDSIIEKDPSCCIAYSMVVSTFFHPIWNFISETDLATAEEYSIRATSCALNNSRTTDREKAYVGAISVFSNTSDPNLADPASRLASYAQAMRERVYIPYVETDENAGILYGLSLLGVGYYSESEASEGLPHLHEAGLIEEQMWLR